MSLISHRCLTFKKQCWWVLTSLSDEGQNCTCTGTLIQKTRWEFWSWLYFYKNLFHKLSDLNFTTHKELIFGVFISAIVVFFVVACAHITPSQLTFTQTHTQKKYKPTQGELFSVLTFCWSFLVFERGVVVLAGIYQNYWFSISSHVLQETDSEGDGEGPQELHEVFKGRL